MCSLVVLKGDRERVTRLIIPVCKLKVAKDHIVDMAL